VGAAQKLLYATNITSDDDNDSATFIPVYTDVIKRDSFTDSNILFKVWPQVLWNCRICIVKYSEVTRKPNTIQVFTPTNASCTSSASGSWTGRDIIIKLQSHHFILVQLKQTQSETMKPIDRYVLYCEKYEGTNIGYHSVTNSNCFIST